MEIVVEKQDEKTIVKLSGRINANNSSELDQKLSEVVSNGDTFVIIDMSGLEYISSAGLRVMLSAYKKIRIINGRIVLCHLQEIVREVFDIAGFSSIFEITPTVAEIS